MLAKKEAGGFRITGKEPGENARLSAVLYPQSIPRTLREADMICSHIFDLLGSGNCYLGEKIDWRQDFISGFRWELTPPRNLKIVDLGNKADVKIPWELSRFQHLVTLGKAYWYAQNKARSAKHKENECQDPEKYAREFISEIEDWIENNPPGYGINWACSMEVAIRAVNWLWGYSFFSGESSLTETFTEKFLKSLAAHGQHIYHNIEIYPGRKVNNHVISDYFGLFYLGVSLRGFKYSLKWLEKGRKGLGEEIVRQVSPEGVDYEGSTYYHRFVTEIFLSALVLGRKEAMYFPSSYLERLEKMLEFIMYYTKPDGSSPSIGDSDDGRLQILSNYSDWDRLDHRCLLSTGAVIFNRPDFKAAAGKFYEESFWLLGEEGLKKFKDIPEAKISLRSRAFSESGYYIMRQDDLYMVIDCLPDDVNAPTGHRHNSRLSFELSTSGTNFIIDPGSYVYTGDPAARNLFRSASYHNTVVIDQVEQNRFRGDDLFSLRRRGKILVHNWRSGEEADFLDAEYRYLRPWKGNLKHRRQFYFSKMDRYWLIIDKLSGRGRHRFCCFFHFGEDVKLKLEGQTLIAAHPETDLILHILPRGDKKMAWGISDGRVSVSYGIRAKALIASWRGSFQNSITFGFIICTGRKTDRFEETALRGKQKYQELQDGHPIISS